MQPQNIRVNRAGHFPGRTVFAAGFFLAAANLFLHAQPLTDTNALKPHQFETAGAPESPAKFNPDFGVKPGVSRPELTPEEVGKFSSELEGLRVRFATNSPPPLPPESFNPDPGANLKPAPQIPPPFYTNDVPAAPVFTGEPVPDALKLPRENVRRAGVVETNSPAGNFGHEPLPPGLELPRENARGNSFIKEKWENPEYGRLNDGYKYPPHSVPMTNRWRIGFAPWRRYAAASVENPYETPRPLLWRPYRQSILKGDAPVIGQDIFLDLTASSETLFEAHRVPTPSGVSTAVSGSSEFFGRGEQDVVQQNFAFSAEMFEGETVFKPVHWEIKIQPVFNVNYTSLRENNGISPNPQRGTDRTDGFVSLQEAFGELHMGDLSENYDFCALRVGNQPFISDFRGFIFNDVNLGARFFGNWDNNRWQYNLAVFDLREKDSNSELNKFDDRDQYVVVANVYRQDFLWHGYTAELNFHASVDDGGTHYDSNGNLARPAPLGVVVPHGVQSYYFGWAGDGHIGRWNVSHAIYEVAGHDDFNGLAGRPVDINAQMAALEVSYDRDWMRYKASAFYASGDKNPNDGTATGFDSITDNPNFTGGPFSWYARQGFNLAGTAVNLKTRNSLLPDLRTSKTEGQANFVNPGALIFGLGAEADITPKLRAFLNANYIRFIETAPIETALLTPKIDNELGWDLSLGFQYRPALTDNIIVSTGFGVLIPGRGYKDIYETGTSPVPGYGNPAPGTVDDFLYSAILAVTLTY